MPTPLSSDDPAREALVEQKAILDAIDAIQQGTANAAPAPVQPTPQPDFPLAGVPTEKQPKESAQQRINRLDDVFQEKFQSLSRTLDDVQIAGDEAGVAPAAEALRALIEREQEMLQQEVEYARDYLGSAVSEYGENATETLEADDAFRRWTNALNLLNTWYDFIRPQLDVETILEEMRARKAEQQQATAEPVAVPEAPKSRTEQLLEATRTLNTLREAILKRIAELQEEDKNLAGEEKKLKDETKKMEIAKIMSTM